MWKMHGYSPTTLVGKQAKHTVLVESAGPAHGKYTRLSCQRFSVLVGKHCFYVSSGQVHREQEKKS